MILWVQTARDADTAARKLRLFTLLERERHAGHDLLFASSLQREQAVSALEDFLASLLRESRARRLTPALANQAQTVLLEVEIQARLLGTGEPSLDELDQVAAALEAFAAAIRADTTPPERDTHLSTAIVEAMEAAARRRPLAHTALPHDPATTAPRSRVG